MRRRKRPPQKTVIDFVYRKTLWGLLRKLPLFIVAALAMWLLTTLDRVRVTHGITNGGDGETAFEIDDRFLESAHSVDEPLKGWLKDSERFKYHRFSNQRELLDALAAKAIVVRDTEASPFVKERKRLTERLEEADKDLAQAKQKLNNVALRKRQKFRQEKLIKDKEADINDTKNQLETNEQKIKSLDAPLQSTRFAVYETFKEQLPKILLKAENRKVGFFDDLVGDSLVDNKNSLHVIYHVFRTTALIVVILSFVFILVMLFQQLPLAGGAETVTDHLKALISVKSGGVGGEIAKTAIVSVTALGVGTAVLVGTNTVSVKSAGNPPVETPETRVKGSYFPPIEIGWDPVSKEYFQQLLMSGGDVNSTYLSYLRQNISNGSQEPITFSPNIDVPEAVVFHTRVADTAGTQAILEQLKVLIAQFKTTPEIEALKNKITIIEAQLKDLSKADCKCDEALQAIADHLHKLRESIGGPLVTNLNISSSPDPVLTPVAPSPSPVPSPGQNPHPGPSPTPTQPDSVIGVLKSTAAALDQIDRDLKAIRADALVNRSSNSGNLLSQAGRVFGSESYLVTDHVSQELNEVMKGNTNRKAFTDALEEMKRQAPLEKKKFLKELRNQLTKNANDNQKKSLLDSLKPWESVILSYARMRR